MNITSDFSLLTLLQECIIEGLQGFNVLNNTKYDMNVNPREQTLDILLNGESIYTVHEETMDDLYSEEAMAKMFIVSHYKSTRNKWEHMRKEDLN